MGRFSRFTFRVTRLLFKEGGGSDAGGMYVYPAQEVCMYPRSQTPPPPPTFLRFFRGVFQVKHCGNLPCYLQ